MKTLVHGWGCSHDIWPDTNHFLFDRGYFNHPNAFKKNDTVVVHSFGLHLLPKDSYRELIILSGFITFSSKKRIVDRMLQKFEVQPEEVLSDFHKLGGNAFKPPKSINKNLLKEDLKQLSDTILPLDFLIEVPTIHLFHGKDDRITPLIWGEELHRKLPQSVLHICEGGHFDTIQAAHRQGFF